MDIQKLKELREKSGLTQTDLASKFGFSNQRYNYYETGRNEPDNQTLIKFAQFFNVSTDYLLGLTDDPVSYKEKKIPSTLEEIEKMYAEFLSKNKMMKDGIVSKKNIEKMERVSQLVSELVLSIIREIDQ